MSFTDLYNELDMSRYARMLHNCVPAGSFLLAVYDSRGEMIWSSDEVTDAQADIISNNRAKLEADVVTEPCICIDNDQNGSSSVIYCSLGELTGESLGELVFYTTTGMECTEESGSKIVSGLSDIAASIKTELRYLYEMNTMAIELGQRYDELSMLRSSNHALSRYNESRHILSRYIRSCAEHLKVDYAAIWIPARTAIYPGGTAYTHGSGDMLTRLEQLSNAAFDLFQKGHDGFGINDKDEELRDAINLPGDKKILVVPVLDTTDKPCGVLCCLKEFFGEDFSNSDKSTLEAVARETFKHLQDTQDTLTGLLNRKGFEDSVCEELSHSSSIWHLAMFNIDQFNVINTVYGAPIGDLVLQSVAQAIVNSLDGLKLVARLESDMFAILVECASTDILNVVKNICDEIDKISITVDGKSISFTSRAGVIALSSKETALADYLYAAELAVQTAKDETGNRVVVNVPGNTALSTRKKQLTQVENIKYALQEGRFELYCQRIEPLSGTDTHYEILVRMLSENGEIVPPDEFIPVAERYNLMHKLDLWILWRALQILSSEEYRAVSLQYRWGINLSGTTVSDPGFHKYVSKYLREFNFPPTNLYFEITETAAIKNYHACVAFMNELHAMGVQFALDDFGSGLSSFSYLKSFAIDYLKIDGSLIKDIVNSRLDQTMVKAIADIAGVMGVETIAEYVENDAIKDVLKSMNISYVQGYGIMKPQPVELILKNECALAADSLRIAVDK
jgi:diguanylate cyclase (GGDEF)-like protein